MNLCVQIFVQKVFILPNILLLSRQNDRVVYCPSNTKKLRHAHIWCFVDQFIYDYCFSFQNVRTLFRNLPSLDNPSRQQVLWVTFLRDTHNVILRNTVLPWAYCWRFQECVFTRLKTLRDGFGSELLYIQRLGLKYGWNLEKQVYKHWSCEGSGPRVFLFQEEFIWTFF